MMTPVRKMIRDAVGTIQEKINRHSDYVVTFGSPQGKRVLTHILKHGYVLKSTFVAGDPQQTAKNEGMRILALSILNFVHADHSEMLKQLQQEVEQENET